jgi:flagellar biosynthetic protein FlhB
VADQPGGQQKTEQPTPRRLQEARRKGQVAKSQELTGAVSMAAVLLLFLIGLEWFVLNLQRMFSVYLEGFTRYSVTPENIGYFAWQAIALLFGLTAPVVMVVLLVALLVNFAQVGFLFAPSVLVPKLERLNPVQGLKRIFSGRGLFEFAKATFKIFFIGALCSWLLHVRMEDLMILSATSPGQGLYVVHNVLLLVAGAAAAAYLLIAMLDLVYQRYAHHKSLMMTKSEVKDEYRQTEGDPHLKSWLRKRQREIAMNRIKDEVPRATVVVTNPIHLAVALRYKEGEMSAPVVTAKGAGYLAARIKELAAKHGVPVVEHRDLARYLYRRTQIGAEVPVAVYQAVAEILAMVYRLRAKREVRSERLEVG